MLTQSEIKASSYAFPSHEVGGFGHEQEVNPLKVGLGAIKEGQPCVVFKPVIILGADGDYRFGVAAPAKVEGPSA